MEKRAKRRRERKREGGWGKVNVTKERNERTTNESDPQSERKVSISNVYAKKGRAEEEEV